ncbi:MAG: type II toxin-antitoxin system VapC family toxin [Chloroflexota bacterium]|nr:type II toxin-antitoxin system VapC family toxin [Chloroflexota bacterium]
MFEGAYVLADPQAGLAAYRRLLAGCTVLDVTEPVAETFAKVRFALLKQGNLIPDMDLLIAATALTFDLTLLTRNRRHFARVPGLRLYQPT